MTKIDKVWAWIAGGVVVVGVGAAAIYESIKHSKGSAPPSPGNTQQLTPGHRYGLTLTCPMSIPLHPPVPDAVVAGILDIPNITIVPGSFTVAAGDKGFAVQFDYTGAAVLPLPAIQAGGATACQTQLNDMGPTPTGVPWGPHGGGGHGGVGGFGVNHVQQVNIAAGQLTVSASGAGMVSITAPGSIQSIVPSIPNPPAVPGPVTGSTASMTLTGSKGTVAISYQTGAPPFQTTQTATVTVS